MRRYLALCLSVLMICPGCAPLQYTARVVPVPKVETMPVWRTEGSVTIGVDPYIQPDRQKEVFDADLEKSGVLPLYLLVENRGDRELSLRPSDIALELPDGSQISPIQTATVLRMLKKSPTPFDRAAGEFINHALLRLFPLIFPLIILAIATAPAAERAREAKIADFANKEFQDVVLSKAASAHGFVYFMPPAGTLWSIKDRLVLRFIDNTDGTSFVMHVPVSESACKEEPGDAKKEEPNSETVAACSVN